MQTIRQIFLLAFDEAREALFRRRAFLSLLMHLGLVLLLFLGVQKAEQQATEALGGQVGVADALKRGVQALGSQAHPDVKSIVDDISSVPLSLLLVQLLTILWFPTLISLVSCDMVAIDVYRGTLRYILLRVSRVTYYVSKFLAHSFLFAVIHGLSLAILVIYVCLTVPEISFVEYSSMALRYGLVFVPAIMFLVAVTGLISSFCRKPLTALMLIQVFWVILVLLFFKWPHALPLSPKITSGLFAPSMKYVLPSVGGFLAWTAGFLAFGMLTFSRREV